MKTKKDQLSKPKLKNQLPKPKLKKVTPKIKTTSFTSLQWNRTESF